MVGESMKNNLLTQNKDFEFDSIKPSTVIGIWVKDFFFLLKFEKVKIKSEF
jgi:hypothetical protein